MAVKLGAILLVVDLLGLTSFGSPPAKQLLSYDYQSKKFILNDDALREIQGLQGPLKIISAIGDARVGKSTNLNFIRYFLGGNTNQRVQKVFKTSDGMEPCTTGVWMSVLRDSNGAAGSTILIDTEGTNLGDNEITNLLSIFTVLMSSGLALFARDGLRNHNVEFLYRVSRVSEQIWKSDALSKNSYPKLMIILRGTLSPSPGNSLESEIKDMILSDKSKYGPIIARYFPRDRIRVRDIPFMRRLSNLETLSRDGYANVVSSLAADFRTFPFKKSAYGGTADGKMIAELAGKLQVAINQKSWSGFSNTYIALETSLCDRGYQEIIEPLLRKNLEEIKLSLEQVMGKYVEKCALKEEVDFTRERISNFIALKDEIKKMQRRLEEERRKQEEEEKKERERQAERRRIALERERMLQEERRLRERAEEEVRIQEEKLQRAEHERSMLPQQAEARRRSRQRERRDLIGTVLGAGVLFGVFSDSRLKENITAIMNSEFEEIGLQGYSWVWSKKATEELGMRGREQGIIAQEVEKLYPWVVVTGADGYKRVDYGALRRLVLLSSKKKKEYSNKYLL